MGGLGSGRKKRTRNQTNTKLRLSESAPFAASYLMMVASGDLGTYCKITTDKDGKVTSITLPNPADPVRVDACKYIINQDIGAPRQRTEITGENGPVVFKVVYD